MDALDYLRFLAALAATLGLLLLAAWGLRKYGHRLGAIGLGGASAPARRRLEIVETLALGPRQRVVILRRDDAEHLLALSPDRATVIEANVDKASTP